MQKQLLFIVFLILLNTLAHAQLPDLKRYPKQVDKIRAAKTFCSKMLKIERYDSLLMGAKMGYNISRTTKDDGINSVFCYYIGAGYGSIAKDDSAIFYYKLSEQYGMHTDIAERVVNAQSKILEVAPRNSALKLEYFNKLEQSYKKYQNDDKIAGEIASNLANVYNDENQYENSLKYHFLELRYVQKLKDSTAIGTSLVNIGNTYIQMSNDEKALEYLNESIPYLNDYRRGQMMAYYNIAACYMDLNKTDAAISNFQKSNNIAKKVNDTVAMYSIEQKLGTAYTAKKQYAKAEEMLGPSTKYAEKIKDGTMMSDGYQALGELYSAQKRSPEAIVWLSKALAISKKNKMMERVAQIYSSMAIAEANSGNFQKAYEYHNSFALYKDTLTKESNKKAVAELETKFQTEKKQQQIKLLSQKEKTQAAELESQRRTKYFLLGGLIAVVIIVGLMIRGYRLKQNANLALAGKNVELEEKNQALNILNEKLDEANRSKTKLFSILSHDLRAPVGSLFQFLNLQKNHTNKLNEEQKQKHNEKIIHSAENLMDSMEDLLIWSKSQMDTFTLKVETTTAEEIVNEVIELHENFAKSKHIKLKKEHIENLTIVADLNFLKIVLRNITSNGIKFTPNEGNIIFSADKTNNEINFRISDDGIGMTDAQINNLFEWNSIRSDSSGMGLRLAKEFTERLGGNIKVTSIAGKGTCFTISIPA